VVAASSAAVLGTPVEDATGLGLPGAGETAGLPAGLPGTTRTDGCDVPCPEGAIGGFAMLISRFLTFWLNKKEPRNTLVIAGSGLVTRLAYGLCSIYLLYAVYTLF
jgi:hypothetical protein